MQNFYFFLLKHKLLNQKTEVILPWDLLKTAFFGIGWAYFGRKSPF